MPLKRLSPKEVASRRERRLCFNYDEKFTRGHKCASRFFLLIADEDNDYGDENPKITPLPQMPKDSPQTNPPQAQISFYALSGHLDLETLCLEGQISNQTVIILINGGSTHNFMQECLVKHLGLMAQPTQSLKVMVGNSNEVDYHYLCPGVMVHVQERVFTVDLHVLPLCGADIVLSVQWLKSLGPVLTDYNYLT